MPQPPWIKPKYRNKRTEYNGRTYASKAEAARAEELANYARLIPGSWHVPQVRLNLAGIPYTVDFLCFQSDGESHLHNTDWGTRPMGAVHCEDVKGMEKQRDRDIQRLWAAGHGLPMPLVILKRKGGKWERKVIEPKLGC